MKLPAQLSEYQGNFLQMASFILILLISEKKLGK